MYWLRNIGFALLTCFIFAGSTGFYIFVHHCKVDGKEQSLFVKQVHKCHPVVTKNSCCHQESSEQKSKDCCNDEIKIIQVEYDYFQDQIQYQFIAAFPALAPKYKINRSRLQTLDKSSISYTNSDLPCPSGRFILVKTQQFRC
jgi:hypothetical protein